MDRGLVAHHQHVSTRRRRAALPARPVRPADPDPGTVAYRERGNAVLGGDKRVDDFYRLFLLPGVDHRGSPIASNGAVVDAGADRDAVVDRVEKGRAPATLPATSLDGTSTRDVCRYPMAARYTGHGDTASAASYRCVTA